MLIANFRLQTIKIQISAQIVRCNGRIEMIPETNAQVVGEGIRSPKCDSDSATVDTTFEVESD